MADFQLLAVYAQETALRLLTPQSDGPGVLPVLTAREQEILKWTLSGKSNHVIGQLLSISPNTVANHVRSILEKTYTANRTEAAAFANREGLLDE